MQDNYLPKSLSELLLVLNESSVYALVQIYGGTRIIIPKKANEHHELATVIGTDELIKLCLFYGSCPLDVPRCVALLIEKRDNAMLADRQSGLTFRQLARKYQLTERGVYLRMMKLRQAKKPLMPIPQLSLFGLLDNT